MSRSNQLPNLDKLFRDDDEQDFTPQGGSNLAAIFGTPQKSEVPSSLRAVPQKKPSSGRSTPQSTSISSSSSKTEVIVAKVVHAYKLQNGQYSLIGKIGIALTGNAATQMYLLILYRTKQEHISVVTLTPEFIYTIGENNYATYYDGKNDNWSILFESTEGSIEFAREVALAKYLLRQGKSEDLVFFQDLTPVKKEEDETKIARENDELDIKYMLISNICQPLKLSNIPVQSMRVQISSDNTWERSLLNAQKNLKRILILPPSKQISLGPGYPREKDVAMEIEIIEIIKPEVKKIPSPKLSVSSGKASLISRMAKMGQSMLPKLPTSTTDSEDTEDEIPAKSPSKRLRASHLDSIQKTANGGIQGSPVSSGGTTPIQTPPVLGQRNSITSTVASPHGSIVPAVNFSQWPVPMQQQFISGADGQLYPLQAPVIPQLPVDPNLSVFLSESRTHNAEIRMGMSKIADNVQKLLDKFHVLEVQNATSPTNEKALETSLKMLMSLNLGKNDARSQEVCYDNSRRLENESSLIESRGIIKSLEDELKATKNSLSEYSNKLEKIESEKTDIEKEKCELHERIQRLESSLADAQETLQKSLTEMKYSHDVIMKHQKEITILESKVITLEAEKELLKKTLTSKKKDHDKAVDIKQIMNKTYQTLLGKFTENSYTSEYIKSIIASTIRNITLQVLKEGRDDFHSSDGEMREYESEGKPNSNSIEDETLMLPDVDRVSDHGVDMDPSAVEEPPPIPPMDLDIGDEWTTDLH